MSPGKRDFAEYGRFKIARRDQAHGTPTHSPSQPTRSAPPYILFACYSHAALIALYFFCFLTPRTSEFVANDAASLVEATAGLLGILIAIFVFAMEFQISKAGRFGGLLRYVYQERGFQRYIGIAAGAITAIIFSAGLRNIWPTLNRPAANAVDYAVAVVILCLVVHHFIRILHDSTNPVHKVIAKAMATQIMRACTTDLDLQQRRHSARKAAKGNGISLDSYAFGLPWGSRYMKSTNNQFIHGMDFSRLAQVIDENAKQLPGWTLSLLKLPGDRLSEGYVAAMIPPTQPRHAETKHSIEDNESDHEQVTTSTEMTRSQATKPTTEYLEKLAKQIESCLQLSPLSSRDEAGQFISAMNNLWDQTAYAIEREDFDDLQFATTVISDILDQALRDDATREWIMHAGETSYRSLPESLLFRLMPLVERATVLQDRRCADCLSCFFRRIADTAIDTRQHHLLEELAQACGIWLDRTGDSATAGVAKKWIIDYAEMIVSAAPARRWAGSEEVPLTFGVGATRALLSLAKSAIDNPSPEIVDHLHNLLMRSWEMPSHRDAHVKFAPTAYSIAHQAASILTLGWAAEVRKKPTAEHKAALPLLTKNVRDRGIRLQSLVCIWERAHLPVKELQDRSVLMALQTDLWTTRSTTQFAIEVDWTWRLRGLAHFLIDSRQLRDDPEAPSTEGISTIGLEAIWSLGKLTQVLAQEAQDSTSRKRRGEQALKCIDARVTKVVKAFRLNIATTNLPHENLEEFGRLVARSPHLQQGFAESLGLSEHKNETSRKSLVLVRWKLWRMDFVESTYGDLPDLVAEQLATARKARALYNVISDCCPKLLFRLHSQQAIDRAVDHLKTKSYAPDTIFVPNWRLDVSEWLEPCPDGDRHGLIGSYRGAEVFALPFNTGDYVIVCERDQVFRSLGWCSTQAFRRLISDDQSAIINRVNNALSLNEVPDDADIKITIELGVPADYFAVGTAAIIACQLAAEE